jgi:hypothetical protein
MTVKDLIEKLKTMPMDAVVVIDMMSECRDLEDGEPSLIRAEDRRLIRRHRKSYLGHDYDYISWDDRFKDPNEPEPEFVTVCHFPGN